MERQMLTSRTIIEMASKKSRFSTWPWFM